MTKINNIFLKKKILIYGLGKSGIYTYNFLRHKAKVNLFDDNPQNNLRFHKKNLSFTKILKCDFDFIIISPGIDFSKCKLSKYLKQNSSKVYTDLDVFYSFFGNDSVTITGTNGKSTTAKLLYDVLKEHRKDVRLTGNIGSPTLLETNLKSSTFFIIEASSYQLEYSKFFKSEYAIILNLSPDHLERHGNFKNYIKAKFKIIQSQSKNNYAFIEKKNYLLNNLIKKNKVKSKIFRVNYEKYQKYYKLISNDYFKNISNFKNLSFVFAISKNLKLNFKKIINVANKFKQLDFRQQVVYQSKKLTIINDSKSTSFSSTIPLLESLKNIYWILGGLAKRGD